MHILIVPSWYPDNAEDGTAPFIREQAQALAHYGCHQVGVIYPKFCPNPAMSTIISGFRQADVWQDEGVTAYRLPVPNWMRKIPYAGAEIWIRRGVRLFSSYIEECGKPDVLHAHAMFYGGLLAKRISKKFHIPFVITEHNSGYARGFVKPWQMKLGSKAVKSASACIAVGESFANLLDDKYETPSGHWQYVPNMVSSHFFEPLLKVRLDPKKADLSFCTICNLNANKGVDLLIKAFAQSFLNCKNIRLIVGGDGPERFVLEQLVNSLGLAEQVVLMGELSRDKVVEVMASSDAYVLPSHYETFGLALAEALALGKPVIATRCGGPESIVLSDNGILVEKNNISALAEALITLKNNISSYDPQKIRTNCKARFGAPVIVKQLTKIYDEVILHNAVANGGR